jgi:hypothetical protein
MFVTVIAYRLVLMPLLRERFMAGPRLERFLPGTGFGGSFVYLDDQDIAAVTAYFREADASAPAAAQPTK